MAGGPVTDNGKVIVARNAVRHGVLSPQPGGGGDGDGRGVAGAPGGGRGGADPRGGMEQALAERVLAGY